MVYISIVSRSFYSQILFQRVNDVFSQIIQFWPNQALYHLIESAELGITEEVSENVPLLISDDLLCHFRHFHFSRLIVSATLFYYVSDIVNNINPNTNVSPIVQALVVQITNCDIFPNEINVDIVPEILVEMILELGGHSLQFLSKFNDLENCHEYINAITLKLFQWLMYLPVSDMSSLTIENFKKVIILIFSSIL